FGAHGGALAARSIVAQHPPRPLRTPIEESAMLGKLRISRPFLMMAIASIACSGAISPAPGGAVTMTSAPTTTAPTPTLDGPVIGASATASAPDASIRPYQVHIPQTAIVD